MGDATNGSDHAGDELEAGYRLLGKAWDTMASPSVVLDAHGTIIEANVAWRLAARLNEGDLASCGLGANYLAVCDRYPEPASATDLARALREILSGRRASFVTEYRAQTPDGERVSLVRATALDHSAGRAALVSHEDVTLRAHLEDALQTSVSAHPLLGLTPRRERPGLPSGLGHGPGAGSGGVVRIGFPEIGEVAAQLGALAANELVAAMGHRASQVVRPGGTLYRIGSAELLVVSSPADEAELSELEAALVRAFDRPERNGTCEVSTVVEIGACGWDEPGMPTWEDLIARARERSRRSGRTVVTDWGSAIAQEGRHPASTWTSSVARRRSEQTTVVLVVSSTPERVRLLRSHVDAGALGPALLSVVGTPAEARSVLIESPQDCVLLDLSLSDKGGVQTLHELRISFPLLPIVVLTGPGQGSWGPTLVEAGAHGHLAEGYSDPAELGRVVAFAIERARVEALDRRNAVLAAGGAEMFLVLGDDLEVRYSSGALASRLGRWGGDVTGDSLGDLMSERDAAVVADVVRRLRSTGAPTSGEVATTPTVSVASRVMSVVAEDLRDEPSVAGTVVRFFDESERLAREEEVRAERVLREVMALQSADVTLFFRGDGTITWASEAARTVLGVDPSDLVGRIGWELVDPRDRQRVVAQLSAIQALGDRAQSEFRVALPTGEIRWVEEIATNLIDNPAVGVVVATIRDVTERRSSTDEIRFQSDLLGAVAHPVMACDAEGLVTYWNAAATETYGWEPGEVLGRRLRDLLPAAGEADQRRLATRPNSRERWSREIPVRTKDGATVMVAASATTLWDGDTYLGYIAVSTDISDRVAREEASAQMAAIVEASSDAIYLIGPDHTIVSWNGGAEQMYGYTPEQIIGQEVTSLATPGRKQELSDLVGAVLAGDAVRAARARRRRSDGSAFDVFASVSPVRDSDGRVISAAIVSRDISDYLEMMRAFEEHRQRLLDAQRVANLGSFDIDLDTGEVTRSEELWRILGYEPGGLPSIDWTHIHPDDRERGRLLLDRVLAGEPDVSDTYRVVRPDGEVRWVSSRLSKALPLRSRKVSGTMLDVTTAKVHEMELERLAYQDPLTDLLNRSGLERRFDSDKATAAMIEVSTVAMLDLDDFKGINDSHGHETGDEVLRAIAARLETVVGPDDTLARFGADQFVIVHPKGRHIGELCRALQDSIRLPLEAGGDSFRLTASVGVAALGPDATLEAALRDADLAVHAAKDAGGDQVVLFDAALRTSLLETQTLERALREAIASETLHLVYQPVVVLDTDRTVGFEALARWDHPELGSVGPDTFIPLAERTGMIHDLGSWVLRTAVAQLAEWIALVGEENAPWVAVNVSARQLTSEHLASEIENLLRGAGVPPRCLHLELTETAMMTDIDRSLARVRELRELGLNIEIDDFGTGYSSLSYLRRMPISTLKIDRSFVAGIETESLSTAIVRTIANLGRDLGMTVHAEGVETAAQLAVLKTLGCDRAQGYFWSPGLKPDAATGWLLSGPAERAPATTR